MINKKNKISILTLFILTFTTLTFDRLSDIFLSWLPHIKDIKQFVSLVEFDNKFFILKLLIFLLFFSSSAISLVLYRDRFSRVIIFILISYCVFEWIVIDPFWLIMLYTSFVVLAILIHNSIEDERLATFFQPAKEMIKKGGWRFLPLPILGGMIAFSSMYAADLPPHSNTIRIVHPAPPDEITYKGEIIKLNNLKNPYRKHKTENPELYNRYVQEGGKVYYENCFFCHGDKLDGKGHFFQGLYPRPANFTDPGTIAQVKESFIFWRIVKGGPGLPPRSNPWNSAMPPWEHILTKDEIWKVILFTYEYTNQLPKEF